MHEHASQHRKWEWEADTVQRHTKIIRYSPWCEVSIVPRPPPPLPFIRGEQLNLQVTFGNHRSTGEFAEYQKPSTLHKLTMKSFKQCLRDVWSVCMMLVLLERSNSKTFFFKTNHYAKGHSTMFHRWYTPTSSLYKVKIKSYCRILTFKAQSLQIVAKMYLHVFAKSVENYCTIRMAWGK